MNLFLKISVLITFFFSCSLALALSNEEESYPIDRVLGVFSKSSDGDIQLQLGFTFPNGCYRTYATLVATNIKEKEILLGQIATLKEGICTMAVVKINSKAEMNRPAAGDYNVIDVSTRSQLGLLRIQEDSVEFFESGLN